MRVTVGLRNPATEELRVIKVGWSWTLFLFSGFFGIPLFMRGLHTVGVALFTLASLNLAFAILGEEEMIFRAISVVTGVSLFAVGIYLGQYGNEINAKKLLKDGWQIVNPDTSAAQFASEAWGLKET